MTERNVEVRVWRGSGEAEKMMGGGGGGVIESSLL